MSPSAGPAHLARAAVEAIAYQIADVFELMESMSGERLDQLLVDGGATRNRWLMQFQADLLQRPIIRSLQEDVSALGAAYLAGKALDWWPDHDDLAALTRETERFDPAGDSNAISDSYQQWKVAIERALHGT